MGPQNSRLTSNHRDQTRWFPVFNVNPYRTVPSFGCMCFSHSLGAAIPSSSTSQSLSPVTDEFGLTNIPHDYPYGTAILEGQGIFRVHQPAVIIPNSEDDSEAFWRDGTLPLLLTSYRSTPQHFWFNLDSTIPPQTPGRGTRDWPVLALIIRRARTVNNASYDNFFPGDRVTFQHNHYFLRRWNTSPIGPGPEGDTDISSDRASWKIIAAENAEFQARSYGVNDEATLGLYWIEPWYPTRATAGNDDVFLE